MENKQKLEFLNKLQIKSQEIWYNIYFKLTDIKFWFDVNKNEIYLWLTKNKFEIIYILVCIVFVFLILLLFN